MKDTKQIAEEAATECSAHAYDVYRISGKDTHTKFSAIILAAIEKATEPEFYDQQKWIAQHNIADEHIYDSVGRVIAKAVYYSPAYRESRAAHASESADTKRLDWLRDNAVIKFSLGDGIWDNTYPHHQPKELNEAIDAAM